MKAALRKSMAILLAASLLFAVAGCSSKGKPEGGAKKAEPYRIGAVVSLTGTYAALGDAEKKAIDLEVKRINDAGGINGREIEIIFEDDGTEESKAVAAASKLIDRDKVIAIIGASGTGQTMAMRDQVDRAGMAQISMAGGTVVTDKFDKNVFQTPWSNRIVVPFVLDAIVASAKSKPVKLALISDGGGYGKDGRGVIVEEVGKRAGQITLVADETFMPGDTDMSAQVTRIKGKGPTALLLWTAGKEAATIVKSAKDLGVSAPMFGGSGQAKTEFISGAGAAAEGFVFGTGRSLIPENWPSDSAVYGAVSDFSTRYKDAYGESPDIFAGHAFDAVTIIADALERAGADATPASLRDAIEQTKEVPGFGGLFTYGPTNHNGLTKSDLALYKIEGGKWVTAE
jgi:branched-chain amino acid transport system substrate-binding protein